MGKDVRKLEIQKKFEELEQMVIENYDDSMIESKRRESTERFAEIMQRAVKYNAGNNTKEHQEYMKTFDCIFNQGNKHLEGMTKKQAEKISELMINMLMNYFSILGIHGLFLTEKALTIKQNSNKNNYIC